MRTMFWLILIHCVKINTLHETYCYRCQRFDSSYSWSSSRWTYRTARNYGTILVLALCLGRTHQYWGKIGIGMHLAHHFTIFKQDETIEFPNDSKNLQFVDNLKDIKPSELNGTGTIAVLKFTNQMNMGKEIFSVIPSSKRSK